MRVLYTKEFAQAAPHPDEKFTMNWGRPIIMMEIPGTTPYGLPLHLHSRALPNPKHMGFYDLLLSARGLADTGFGPLEVESTSMITCQLPYLDEDGSVAIKDITGPAAHMYAQRAKAADELLAGRTALLRHFCEYSNDTYMEKMQKALELVFLRKARLIFVEKKVELIFSMLRYAITSRTEDGPFAVTEEQVNWFKRCWTIYHAHKKYWEKNNPGMMAVVDIESIMKGRCQVKWGDGVTATLDLPNDEQAKGLLWENVNYRSVTNFKQVEAWLKPRQTPGLFQGVQQSGQTEG